MTLPQPAATKTHGWLWLLVAAVFEIGFTFALRMQNEHPQFGLMFLICVIAAFEGLRRAIQSIPLGIAYAVFTGIGAVGTVIVGITVFDESASPLRLGLVIALICCVVALKSTGPKAAQSTAGSAAGPVEHP